MRSPFYIGRLMAGKRKAVDVSNTKVREDIASQLVESADGSHEDSKTYMYNPGRFTWEVTIQGIICIVLAVMSIILMVRWNWPIGLMVVVCLVSLYGAFKTFISKSYSSSVTITSKSISFSCYGSTVTYQLADLNDIRQTCACMSEWTGILSCKAGIGLEVVGLMTEKNYSNVYVIWSLR